MFRFLLLFLSLTVFTLSTSQAAIYKGQKIFIKQCLVCHESGQNLVSKYTMSEWKKLMKKKGEGLAKLHLDNPDAEASWEYFNSAVYSKKSKHLKQFLIEYAKDSGNVPACN